MKTALSDHRPARPGPQDGALRDYDSVRRAIEFISANWRTQPTIEAIADGNWRDPQLKVAFTRDLS